MIVLVWIFFFVPSILSDSITVSSHTNLTIEQLGPPSGSGFWNNLQNVQCIGSASETSVTSFGGQTNTVIFSNSSFVMPSQALIYAVYWTVSRVSTGTTTDFMDSIVQMCTNVYNVNTCISANSTEGWPPGPYGAIVYPHQYSNLNSTWNMTLTPAIVTDSLWGFRYAGKCLQANAAAQMSCVTVTIYYSVPSPSVTPSIALSPSPSLVPSKTPSPRTYPSHSTSPSAAFSAQQNQNTIVIVVPVTIIGVAIVIAVGLCWWQREFVKKQWTRFKNRVSNSVPVLSDP